MWALVTTANLVHAFWILLLQIPILKAHLIRGSASTSRSRSNSFISTEVAPSVVELCLATLIFWTVQLVSESSVTFVLSFILRDGQRRGVTELGDLIQTAIWDTLLSPFIATWTLHLAFLAILEFVLPSVCAVYFYPASAVEYSIYRARNLRTFMLSLLSISKITRKIPTQPPRRHSIKHQRTRSQSLPTITNNSSNGPNNIRLERTHSYPHAQLKGSRTLDWNLVVDLLAMNEMKETLGPPGGFGELGFCVQKDGVKFECMGPGTSFSLTFKLEGDEEASPLNGNGIEVGSVSSGRSRKKKR